MEDKHDCHGNATCTNTDGNYTCSCDNGYEGDGWECENINECLSMEDNDCDAFANCTGIVAKLRFN